MAKRGCSYGPRRKGRCPSKKSGGATKRGRGRRKRGCSFGPRRKGKCPPRK